jgi:hypothetical protein
MPLKLSRLPNGTLTLLRTGSERKKEQTELYILATLHNVSLKVRMVKVRLLGMAVSRSSSIDQSNPSVGPVGPSRNHLLSGGIQQQQEEMGRKHSFVQPELHAVLSFLISLLSPQCLRTSVTYSQVHPSGA